MAEFTARLRAWCRQFRRSEDGSLLVFGLFLFSIFILMSGMAIDVMRAENRRVALSQALDRCALNAAALSQALDPETVLRDCVERDGMLPFLTSVQVHNQPGQRSVAAAGEIPLETLFMGSMGIERLSVDASARAEEGRNRIEIVLVLDISGSMNERQRMVGLREAAKNFVESVLRDSAGEVSIAIVPYNAQVNIGSELASFYNITHRSGLGVTVNGDMRRANCVDFTTDVYDRVGLSRTEPLSASGWMDPAPRVQFQNHAAGGAVPVEAVVPCRASTTNIIRLPDNDPDRLARHIDALAAEGNTSINIGMKWGSALLDPQARPVIDAFVNSGAVPSAFRGRPFDYNRPDVTKIIVLMTDGANVIDDRLNEPYKTGLSPIFRGTDGHFSLHMPTGRPSAAGSNEYWVPHIDSNPALNGAEGAWMPTPWGNATATRLTWPELWQYAAPQWVAWHLFARASSTVHAERQAVHTLWVQRFLTRYGTQNSGTIKDDELQRICTASKRQGVIIYGIAFSAPERGAQMIQSCATSPDFAFRSSDNTQLNAAFQAIAINIGQLRLTN